MGNPAGLGIYAGVGKGKKPKRSYIQSIKKYGKRVQFTLREST